MVFLLHILYIHNTVIEPKILLVQDSLELKPLIRDYLH